MRKQTLRGRGLVLSTFLALAIVCPAARAPADVLYADVPVSDSGTSNSIAYPNTSRNVAAGPDGTIYVLYYNPSGIWVARSANRGESFQTPVQVNASSSEAELAVDADGIVYVAWVEGGQATFSRSTDSGVSFSAPSSIGSASGTVHMTVDAPYVYIITKDGTTLFRNSSSGAGAFGTTTVDTSRAYADAHVDPETGNVYVQTDDPTVYVFKSTDHGATFDGPHQPGGLIYYSTTVLASTESGAFLYTCGNGNTALRIDVSDYSQTTLTFGTTTIAQGRTLAVDGFSNVIDGYVDGTAVKYAISTDNGESFDTPVTIASASYLSLGLNRRYGDIVAAYEQGGEIFCTVYGGEIVQAPTVDTATVSDIAATSATCGGDVVADGGADVTARGVCWSTSENPTTADDYTEDGSGTGEFTSSITGLDLDTTYHVRAYATNSAGTAYGAGVTFATVAEESEPEPEPEPELAPDLRVTIEAQADADALVGDDVAFTATVENVGTATATDVVLTVPLPENTEFVSARRAASQAAQAAPLNATVEDGEITIEVGDVAAGEEVEIELVLQALVAGQIAVNASATSEETPTPVSAQTAAEVDVEDVYWTVVQTITPIHACGVLGIMPVFVLLGLVGLKRRGRQCSGRAPYRP